ncbi:MAG: peptidyl-prolyl cis-trans isomerase [Candidatus Krumholzibacteria bacterium]|nr:peptidyl-prolyl cis-trans isomerase [Candidatus Krumholzibacteria bacterium]
MKRALLSSIILISLAFVAFSCGEEENKIEINDGVAIRIGNKKITDSEIDEKFELLPDNQRNNFAGPTGRARFVDLIINDELFYLEAKNRNLINDPIVKAELEAVTRRILIGAFYQKEVVDNIEVSDTEVESYYDTNSDEFSTLSLYKAQHIFSEDSMKCVQWKKRIDEGEKFSAIAKAESEDHSTASSYGDLGYFNPDGFIKFIGKSRTFTDDIFGLAVGEVSGVIKHEKGYSLVRLNDHKPASIKPLSEVRKSILEKLRGNYSKENLNRQIETLRKKYSPINYAREYVLETTRTPEQLWEIAQAEDASYTRILYYRELVNRYPEHKFAPQALFMIGFVYAEELQDLAQARRTFDELLKDYPDSEVVESSKWMIENLHQDHPRFESFEGVQEHLENIKE